MADGAGFTIHNTEPPELIELDMGVLRLHRRRPPPLPLDVFGPGWRQFIETTADAAACPPDFVAAPLLATASALIGNARWAQGVPGWVEPPHLWCAAIGESGTGKSPGADCLLRDVLPELEERMMADFPEKLREWEAATEREKASREAWEKDVRKAQNQGVAPPLPPSDRAPSEPQAPRLRQNDITIEKVAALLAGAAPKGLLFVRDELAGWFAGMTTYNQAGRAFWIEAYGGRPYRVGAAKASGADLGSAPCRGRVRRDAARATEAVSRPAVLAQSVEPPCDGYGLITCCPGCGSGRVWRLSILSGGPGPWCCSTWASPPAHAWLDGCALPTKLRTEL